MFGLIWGCFWFWGWIGESVRRERLRFLLNVLLVGKSSIWMFVCIDCWCVISLFGGCLSILSKFSWWWLVVMGVGGFLVCCWVW